ncbi:BrnA antitoxin family protein [Methyloprofundus sedimenti]|uniref:BrnA antitoxin family protein n=1 Tax=Methyloprofundus sedimenti TaxID=1420851 RepID=UPI00117DCD3D|nr:BrnA antitoxin family protein [Methyloprofundus sedimenti]
MGRRIDLGTHFWALAVGKFLTQFCHWQTRMDEVLKDYVAHLNDQFIGCADEGGASFAT